MREITADEGGGQRDAAWVGVGQHLGIWTFDSCMLSLRLWLWEPHQSLPLSCGLINCSVMPLALVFPTRHFNASWMLHGTMKPTVSANHHVSLQRGL